VPPVWWGGSWRHPDTQAQTILYFICLLSASGSLAEQTAHSACDSWVFSFPPCELLKGREEAVPLQAHLHLFSLPLPSKEVKLLHKQNVADRIPGQILSVQPD
jgi:hypothetical protein